MRTNNSKTSVDSKLEEMEEKYPVEQIAVKNEKKITAKETQNQQKIKANNQQNLKVQDSLIPDILLMMPHKSHHCVEVLT